MVTFSDLIQRILRKIDDIDQVQASDSLIYDGVVSAHDAILPWVPKFAYTTLTAGSNGYAFTLPSDLYLVQALQDPIQGLFVPRATLAPRTARNVGSYADNDWIEYPSGYLSLSSAVPQGSALKLYYLAYWNIPADDADLEFELEIPRHVHAGIVYYASAYCLDPKAVSSARIRQFNQRIDSGNPEDNPLQVQAGLLLERFYQEMKLMPSYVKAPQ